MKTILSTVVGSTLHGTSVNDGLEDLDLMAIGIESEADFIGFKTKDCITKRTKPMGVRSEAGDVDYVEYGLKKYLALALKGNPTVLLPLFAPKEFVRFVNDVGHDLRFLKDRFITKAIYNPYKGYIVQQKERLLGTRGQRNVTRPELVEKYGYDTKYAGHVVRLAIQGVELLTDRYMTLPMPEASREVVLNVRRGWFGFSECVRLIEEYEAALDKAYEKSALPETPDVKFIESWMIEQYIGHWN